MEKLLKINRDLLEKKVHVLIRAAFFHHAFSTIHPFQDGNGRVVRILASLILIKDGYFPFTVVRKDRKRYIQALEMADTGEYQLLIDMIAENQIKAIGRVITEDKLIEISKQLAKLAILDKDAFEKISKTFTQLEDS